jgi:hypothetical protein
MNSLKKVAIGLALSASFCTPVFADVTQTTSPVSSDQYSGSNAGALELSSVTFAPGTNNISAFTSSVTLVDQGWGGQTSDNGVFMELLSGGVDLFRFNVAGSSHDWTTVAYDISNDPTLFSALNAALFGIDQSNAPEVRLAMVTNAWGYPGWELHTQDASFSVTSGTVPEPTTVALLGLGLLGFAASRRKAAKK